MKKLFRKAYSAFLFAIVATMGLYVFADTPGRTIRQGIGPVRMTLAEACKAGDLLGYSAGWKLADANNTIYAELVAGHSGAIGDEIVAYRLAVVAGTTSLGGTAGGAIYLSDTAGGYVAAAGTVSQVVGFLVSANEMLIAPACKFAGMVGSAYAQTYATADKTHANSTYAAPSGGATQDAEARASLAQLAVDVADLKQLANSIIDDLQAAGIVT